MAAYAKNTGYYQKGGDHLVEQLHRQLKHLVPVCLFFAFGVIVPAPDNVSVMSHVSGISLGMGIGYLLHLLVEWKSQD
jgi:hypothetical protein